MIDSLDNVIDHGPANSYSSTNMEEEEEEEHSCPCGLHATHPEPPVVGRSTLVRWFIDTGPMTRRVAGLPLIETLREADQETVKRFYHLSDKHMSLASQLLKYYIVHRACRVRWNKISIDRTPDEGRPYFRPESVGPKVKRVEFNLSHQASLTILAGTFIIRDHTRLHTSKACEDFWMNATRVGIDITCVGERRGNDRTPKTLKDLASFVDIFADVFSLREMLIIKNPRLTLVKAHQYGYGNMFLDPDLKEGTLFGDEEKLTRYGLRLFYSYWALKEAYVKMQGEALIAPWLRDLTFTNVIPPDPSPYLSDTDFTEPIPVQGHSLPRSPRLWGRPYRDIKITLKSHPITDTRMQLVAFRSNYIIATASRGPYLGPVPKSSENDDFHHLPGVTSIETPDGPRALPIDIDPFRRIGDPDPWNDSKPITDPWLPVQELDIERDIRACAEGRCQHVVYH